MTIISFYEEPVVALLGSEVPVKIKDLILKTHITGLSYSSSFFLPFGFHLITKAGSRFFF